MYRSFPLYLIRSLKHLTFGFCHIRTINKDQNTCVTFELYRRTRNNLHIKRKVLCSCVFFVLFSSFLLLLYNINAQPGFNHRPTRRGIVQTKISRKFSRSSAQHFFSYFFGILNTRLQCNIYDEHILSYIYRFISGFEFICANYFYQIWYGGSLGVGRVLGEGQSVSVHRLRFM